MDSHRLKRRGKFSVSDFSSQNNATTKETHQKPFSRRHNLSQMQDTQLSPLPSDGTKSTMLPSSTTTPVALSSLASSTISVASEWPAIRLSSSKLPPSESTPLIRLSDVNTGSSTNSGRILLIAFGVVVLAGLLIAVCLAVGTRCCVRKTRGGDGSSRIRLTQDLPPRHEQHGEGEDGLMSAENEQVMPRDVEAHASSPEAQAVVGTARQGRVYKPGSVSLVEITRKREACCRRGVASGYGRGSSFARSAPSLTGRSGPSSSRLDGIPSVTRFSSGNREQGVQAPRTVCGGVRMSSEHLSLREALSDEGMLEMTCENKPGGDLLCRVSHASNDTLETPRGHEVLSAPRSYPREPLRRVEDVKPLPAPKGKRQRNVLRKRVTSSSRQLLSDVLKAYTA